MSRASGGSAARLAEELGIPEGTAVSRRRRARERFALSLWGPPPGAVGRGSGSR